MPVWVVIVNIFINVIHCIWTLNKCTWITEMLCSFIFTFFIKIHTWVYLNFFYTNKFCQNHVVPLSNEATCLFFLIQNHGLSRFSTDDLQYIAIFHCVLCCTLFICNTVCINHFVMYNSDSFEKSQISSWCCRLF